MALPHAVDQPRRESRLLVHDTNGTPRRRESTPRPLPKWTNLSSARYATRTEAPLLLIFHRRASRQAPRARLLRTTDERLAQRPPNACSRRQAGASVEPSPPRWRAGRRACRSSRGPGGDAGNNPCRWQGDRVVAPGSTGRRLLVEDDDGASGGTPILSSPMAWRRASAAGRPLTGRASPDGRPGGGGVRWATLRTIK
jgi:hypothetical protein